ncbi:MAG: YqgE/AlgH family protein [Tepidisphaeraceae bacterium]
MKPSLRGHFLLASNSLMDPNFSRSVVLLVKHDEDGALGLIINRPLPVTVAEALGDALESVGELQRPLYKGGPCTGPLMALSGMAVDKSEEVIMGVHFCVHQEALEKLIERDALPSRYVLGYAGWGSEQLEQELAEGAWMVAPATPQDVFTEPTDELWARLMSRANLMKFISPDFIPDDPSSN